MAENNKSWSRKKRNKFSKSIFHNDLGRTYPVGGKFLKVGRSRLLLVKTVKKDDDGNPVYLGTLIKRKGLGNKVSSASHIVVKPI